MNNYPHLFTPITLAGKTAKNRIVMAPMGDNMANPDGSVSEQEIAYYGERAKGGAGIIMMGVVDVEHPRGKTIPCESRLDDFKFIEGFTKLSTVIHSYGALFIPQLCHAGSSTEIRTTEGETPVCVSSEDQDEDRVSIGSVAEKDAVATHELTTEEIKEIEGKFIATAVNAQMAGCDGVEIHGAHGYLVSQFLNSQMNHRTDEYGGDIENRGRFAVNIVKGIREACGPNFIIGIRMPVHNWDTDGITDEESRTFAKMMEDAGCDLLNISGGFTPTITNLMETQQYEQGDRLILIDKIRDAVSIPVMGAGLLREPEFCENMIAEGRADLAVLGRTLVADPEWPNKAKAGKPETIRRCISCLDACYGNLAKGQYMQCVLNPEAGLECELRNVPMPTEKKKVVVVGGGIGGMEAAITAAKRGHEVTLFEKSDKLGGQMNLACVPPHKEYIHWAYEWFTGEVERQFVDVRMNEEATEDKIKEISPDVVIMAAGAVPADPPIPGIEKAAQAWDILEGNTALPESKKVAVLGGGIVGCELANMMAEKGCEVSLIEMLPTIANGLEPANRLDMEAEIKGNNIDVHTNSKVTEIKDDGVCYEADGEAQEISTDCVVVALGNKPCGCELTEALQADGIDVTTIGDAKQPRKFRNATQEGYFAALYI